MPNLINQISVLGSLRVAGALIIDQNNTDFPSNPVPGTLAIVGLSLYAYVTIAGIQAWYPLVEQAMGTANYVHTQVVPNTTWTVQHNLNTPASEIWYQIQDNNNTLIDANSLVEIDNNSFELHFTTAQSGRCVLVGTTQVIIDNAEISDGTTVQIHGYANRPLNIVAGNGINITFDDNTKSITFDAGTVLAAGTVVETAISNIETAVGLNFDGSYNIPTSSNYLNNSINLSDATNLLDTALKAETTRATTAEAALTTRITTEATDRVSAYTTLVGDLDSEVISRSAADSAEAATRSSADNVISIALASEITRATTAEGTLTSNLASVSTIANNAVTKTTTVNGHALSGNVTVSASDVGLGNVSNVAQLANTQALAITGDVTATSTNLNTGTIATTLSTTGVTAGTYNNSLTAITPFTVDVKGRITTTGSAVIITPAWNNITSRPTTLSGYGITDSVNSSTLGTANGVATLDASGKLPLSQLTASIVGALVYQGVWNANTNSPALVSGTGTKGQYYKVAVTGSTTVDGNSQWNIGDMIVFDGTVWDKIDGVSTEVTSVAGRVGAIVLSQADISGLTTASTPTFAGVNATTFTGSLVGNASTASSAAKLTTACTISGTSFDGSANITLNHTGLSNIGTNTHAQIDTALTRLVNTSGTNTGDQTNITGNAGTANVAATVTTNANLTGVVTSVGNATSIGNGVITNAMLANSAVANLSGTNTGDQTITLTGAVTGSGVGSFATTLTNASVTSQVLTGYASTTGTVSATDSILTAIGKLNGNTAALTAAVTGALVYQGVWNANTNSPALVSGTGTKGWYYKVNTAGTTAINGISQWNVGDMIVFNGTTWDKIDGVATEVTSVAGRVGAVTLSQADIAGLTTSSSPTFAAVTASTFTGNLVGNANTVTTNANLTGVVTSVGNATSIGNGVITNTMLANSAVANLSGTNTGDETLASIKTKLGISTLSGSNTGDQSISISGDVTATGSTGVLTATVTKINGVSLAGLTTGLLKNTTTTGVPSIATAGTDYVAPGGDLGTPSSGVATNLTGTASGLTAGHVTTNANLTGVVTSVGNATSIANGSITNAMLANSAVANLSGTNTGDQTITLTGAVTGSGVGSFATTLTNASVTGQALTGFSSTTGTITASDTILTAINKLNGNLSTFALNNQVGTTYTTVLSDGIYTGSIGNLITFNNASAQTVTIPPNSSVAYPIGTTLQVAQLGAGKVTFAAGSGVTINSAGGLKSIGAQYAAATLIQTAANTWLLIGSLIP